MKNKHNLIEEILNNWIDTLNREVLYWQAERDIIEFNSTYCDLKWRRFEYCEGAIKALNNMIYSMNEEVCK